jgi:DNA-binding CsgD family transcriptional regulator
MMASLTQREASVCDLIIEGLSTKEIARRLQISPRTVEAHRAAVFAKKGVRNAVELVRSTITGAKR